MYNLSDYLHSKASRNKVPLSGTFELSPVCNFACKMCYVRRTPEQIKNDGKEIITWDKWLELAKQCRDAGTLYLLLTGGEPFLYPGFKELYTELHKMGFILYINSNGTLIDEAAVEWLKKYAPGRVNVTLYGASPETYERICGNPKGFELAMDAIKMLTEAKIPVVINASMIPENECDLEKIIEIGKSLGLNTRMSTYMFPPMRREREDCDSRFTAEQSAQMYMRKIKCLYSKEEYFEFLERNAKGNTEEDNDETWGTDTEFMRCRAGRSSFWVNWEGNMTACGMMDFPMKTTPFTENFCDCWMKLTDSVRNAHVLKGCAGCKKRNNCNPCVAMIYGETGTVDEKAPYMCRLSECVSEIIKKELEELRDE
ncbi:MAG: radical SAM protein [Oscillospiraceae bacterium]|nr:radical SAM protein [Oscillospiraceae bacterium]